MQSRALALFVLNVLYCLLAAVQEGVPGWHMFESVERIDAVLRDKDGVVVDLEATLPRHARIVDRSELYAIAGWICRRERGRGPFVLDDRARGRSIPIGDDCRVHAPR